MKKFRLLLLLIVFVPLLVAVVAMVAPEFMPTLSFSREGNIFTEARMIHYAMEKYAARKRKKAEDPVQFEDLRPYLRARSRLVRTGGKDQFGNAFLIGPTLADGVRLSPDTRAKLMQSGLTEAGIDESLRQINSK